MSKTTYKLELDCFSGRQNPVFEITEEDFAALQRDIQKLEATAGQPLYDGLGFRGFILSDTVATFISIQKNIIKIQLDKDVQYKKNNQHILSRLISVAREYDEEKAYETLIGKIAGEYLI